MLPGAPIQAFARFGNKMRASYDIDPVYPVLHALIHDLHLDEAKADWLTVLYLAYYELSSGLEAFLRYPDPALARSAGLLGDFATLKLPTGIERRGLRQPHLMAEHLDDWLGRFDGGSFFTGVTQLFSTDREFNCGALDMYLRSIRFNGRWAAYKGCEVMQKVRGYAVQLTTAGHENSTGPRDGLALFFPAVRGQRPEHIAILDEQTRMLMAWAEQFGCPLQVEECETLLCDFRSLATGRYYVGHDIDLMLEGIGNAAVEVQQRLMRARRALPHEYRGESHGWDGRDREAMGAYAERGAILFRAGPDGHFEDAAAAVAA
jgi:hypothetical protein